VGGVEGEKGERGKGVGEEEEEGGGGGGGRSGVRVIKGEIEVNWGI